MAIATEFTALGGGNGFPSLQFARQKVDVSDYDYWTTLSGWSKVSTPANDTAKKESIEKSRRLAMKIYWNLYSMNTTIDSSYTSGNTIDESASLDEVTMLYYPGVVNGDTGSAADNPYAEPMSRVCATRSCAARNDSNPGGISYTSAYAYLGSLCCLLYDDELFVGYGFLGKFYARAIASSQVRAIVEVGSYGNSSAGSNSITFDYAYTKIDGEVSSEFDVFCKVMAGAPYSNQPNNETRIASASDLSGSASSASYGTTSSSFRSASAQINGFDFYTYS